MKSSKTPLIIGLFVILIAVSLAAYFYFQREAKKREAGRIKILLTEINEVINLMDAVKNEMPKELLETHEYLMSGALGGRLYGADPRLKNVIMYHGAKTRSVYINPAIRIKKELWIPVFYHEIAHNYWHGKNPAETFEEFEAQLFDSENYAYAVNAQAWDLAMRYYPIKKEELKTELEQRLFDLYGRDAYIYGGMVEGDSEAKEFWNKIIEANLKEQKKQQELLFDKQ